MSGFRKPYANIVRQGAYLVARRLSLLPQTVRKEVLVGTDTYSGLVSLLGGCFDPAETNPYYVAVREGRGEGGDHLLFMLLDAMPLMFYTDAVTGKVLDTPQDTRHPAHPDYDGHPVVLRFRFDVLEFSGIDPYDNDAGEITGVGWKTIDLCTPQSMRPSTYHGLKTMDWEKEPQTNGHLSADFKHMYEIMEDKDILNVHPQQAYTWSNHGGMDAIQAGQPHEKLLRRLDEKWKGTPT